jgi:clan AA aspartic protease
MNGEVDKRNRALLTIAISKTADGPTHDIVAWIDTAFDGHLVFSRDLIDNPNLDSLAETEAILADGSKVVIETFLGFANWFGTQIPVQVIANEGRFPLLGTELLAGRELLINYRTTKIRLT